MLQRGDQVPHFAVTQPDGAAVDYATTVWQTRNLLLVSLPADPDEAVDAYARSLRDRADEMAAAGTTCVVTRDEVPGAPRPGVLIADRWGEVYFAVEAQRGADLPAPVDLMDWLRYVQHECPECQGETK